MKICVGQCVLTTHSSRYPRHCIPMPLTLLDMFNTTHNACGDKIFSVAGTCVAHCEFLLVVNPISTLTD